MFKSMTRAEFEQWLESISREIDERRAYGPQPHSTFVPWPGGGYLGETNQEQLDRLAAEAQ